MSRLRCITVLWLAAWLAPWAAAEAQQGTPHIGYVYPAGGQRGTTFQVKVGGQFLEGVGAVRFSAAGVQATFVERAATLTKKEVTQLKEKLKELQQGKKDAETEKQTEEIKRKLAALNKKSKIKSENPAIGEVALLNVTLSPDAEPGQRELRLETSRGVSNPLVFCVGQLPEFCKKDPQSAVDLLSSTKSKRSRESATIHEPIRNPCDAAAPITLPATVNGQIMPNEADPRFARADPFAPGDVDRYRFQARKGQQLVVAVSARQLIPYLADAVPGWFQATVALYDAKGKELAYDDDYRFHPDPVLFYKIPADGQYVIEIKDALYRGRAGFRLSHHRRRVAVHHRHFPPGRPGRQANQRRASGLESPRQEARDGSPRQGPGNLSALRRTAQTWFPTACLLPSTRCRNASKRNPTTHRKTPSRSRFP